MRERILVIQTAFLGDAILTLPLIQEVKKKYKDTEIDVIAIPSTKEIFTSSPYVNDVLVLDKRGRHKFFYSIIKFAGNIRKRKYSKIFSPHRSFRTSLIVLISGVKDTYGFDTASMSFIYKNKIKYKKDRHEVWRNLSLLDEEKYSEDWKILPEVSSSESEKIKVKSILEKINLNQVAVVAPGSVWNTKKYPLEYFVEIINYLNKKSFSVVLIGSKEDRKLCEGIKSKSDENVLNVAGELSISESIELLKKSKFLICNDSAPTHMGMAADIPVLTLYCSTVADFGFYPYNKKSFYLSFDELDCKPCGIHGYKECPLGHFNCGKFLKPEYVIKKLEEFFL